LEALGWRVGDATASSGPGASGASKASCKSADRARASKDPVRSSEVRFADLGKSLKFDGTNVESSVPLPLGAAFGLEAMEIPDLPFAPAYIATICKTFCHADALALAGRGATSALG
jgi:hypothetical protein